MIEIREANDGLVFGVKVSAGASREAIIGEMGGMLKVRVSAAREKGKANTALLRLLAKALGVGRGDLEILRGESATVKSILVKGSTFEKICALAGESAGSQRRNI